MKITTLPYLLTWLIITITMFILSGCTKEKEASNNLLTMGDISLQVPDGYTLEIAAGSEMVEYPMFATLDETGRLFLFESVGNVYETSEEAIANPRFQIKLLEDLDGDGKYDKSTLYADKVGFPQGGVFYKGSLYASSAPDLLKFTDTDGDGVADKREVLLSGWVLNINANSLIGPFMGPDGWLYMTSAIEGFDVMTKEGKRLKGETARVWRVRTDGTGLEWISAGGMNNPVELTFTAANELIGTETYFTNPKAGQRDALVYWTEGGVYPKPNNNINRDGLIRTGELMPVVTKYSRVTPVGICRYRNSVLGEDFKDNLFSTQFNTHRVVRHKLFRDGASFRTEDEDFLWSDHEDFHPTDILEDSDGSLLVVETGGWFIKGCPLSQVSKPELKGNIYRIKKDEAASVKDPYGNNIEWSSLTANEAFSYLQDQRPHVSDRAAQALVDLGEESIEVLSNGLQSSSSADTRTKAVFVLYRIGNASLSSLREALADPDEQVKVAAARCVGLARDTLSTGKLLQLVKTGTSAVKRQSATALGQIKDPKSVPSLLEATENTEDRFIQHAIIYALIAHNRPDLIVPGLSNNSTKIQEASLITLDQIPEALKSYHLTPFLNSDTESLQRTALWIASHHPEWSLPMITFLRDAFSRPNLFEEKKESYRNILISFCDQVNMQWFIIELFQNASPERKLFVLDVMKDCPLKELPSFWQQSLGHILSGTKDLAVLLKAIALVRQYEIKSLEPILRQIVNLETSPPELKINALTALTDFQKELNDVHFEYILSQLTAGTNILLKQQAAMLLGSVSLHDVQLSKLVTDYLPVSDEYTLTLLLPSFKGSHSAEIGRALITALSKTTILENVKEEDLLQLFEQYPPLLNPEIDGLMAKVREARSNRIVYLKDLEEVITKGNLDNGRLLFFEKAACSGCHTIGGEGDSFGPDLTSIQRDRSFHDLLEAIVYPDASIVREFDTYTIKTSTNTYTGIIQEQTPELIVLGTAPGASVNIDRSEIISMEVLSTSLMPQGLDKRLTKQEMADLMAFLIGQDQNPETDQKILR